ncbi:MAG: M48 family metallopeptidase [Verrucomicrobiales bacterium]|nr:M48 family metallopeptidase [Verrucomicrobiales bacterium]
MKSRSSAPLSALVPAVSCLALVITLVACTTTVPETGRKQLNMISPSKEAALGLSEFQKIRKEKPISTNATYNATAQRVGRKLSLVMPVPNAEWEFVVFEDPTPNAFALPGGKVGIHSGLFQITKDDAGLAAVMGHEVAHVVARHSGERLSQNVVAGAIVTGAGYAMNRDGRDGALATAALGGGALVATRSFSRQQELEADQMGALFMARAGYDPRESIGLWERFAAWKNQNGQASKMPQFLSTHPVDERRITELRAYMPKAMAEYKGGR